MKPRVSQLAQSGASTGQAVVWNGTDWAPAAVTDAGAIPKTLVDAKGDILTATADNTPARLAVGSNGQLLSADSTQSTGLAWVSALTDPTTTKGDLLARSSSALNRLAVGTDGYVLTADSTQTLGVKWAAGGGGGSTRPYLDQTTLHSTYGDDFTAGSLDAKWTRRNLTTETFQTADDGWLQVSLGGSGSVDKQYHQTAPSGDFEVTLSMTQFSSGIENMFGPMIIDSSGNGVGVSTYQNLAVLWNLSAYTYSSYGNQQYFNGSTASTSLGTGGLHHWLRIKKVGTTYTGYFSLDGRQWSNALAGSSVTWSGTVNRIGFGRWYYPASMTVLDCRVDRFNVL